MNYTENLLYTLGVIIPLVALMFGGYVAKQKNMVNATTAGQCNNLVFKIFLPLLLFNNLRSTTITSISEPQVFLFVALAIPLLFILVTLLVVIIEKDNPKRGVMIQGMCRSNYAIFGLPMVSLLQPGEDLAVAATLIAVVIPAYNIFSVIVLTIFGGGRIEPLKILKSLATNNLIIATLCGIAFMVFGIKLPVALGNTIDYFAVTATPLALFMLGAKFDFSGFLRIGKQLVIICFGKLAVLPTIVVAAAILLGFRGVELTCLMVIFYAPTAASSYVMAVEMGGDGDLASSTVVVTTTLSTITMFIVIFTLKNFGMI